MSVTSAAQRGPTEYNIPTCATCGNYRNPNKSYNGSFCSQDCWFKHKGEKAVNLLAYDHRLCASCGRWLKEVHTPNEEWIEDRADMVQYALDNGASLNTEGQSFTLDITECTTTTQQTAVDSVIGFQTRTKNAEVVEKEFSIREYRRVIDTGTGCKCGATDTRYPVEELQGVEMAKVLANYVHRFRELEREGQLDQRINKDIFFSSFKASEDLLYALGKALYE